jgi:hypothetical protein
MKLALCKKVEHLRFVLILHDSSNAESTGRAAEAGDFVHLLLCNHKWPIYKIGDISSTKQNAQMLYLQPWLWYG